MLPDATTSTQSSEIYFFDTGMYIYASVDGQLDVVADTEVQIAATTVDINGIVDISGRINNGTGFWADAPSPANNDLSEAFFYINDFVGETPFPTATGAANGWVGLGDATYDVLTAAGTLGGWCLLAPEAVSDNELYLQMGELGTENFVEITAASGKELWIEYNLTPSSVTNAASWFVGVAEEGLDAENTWDDGGADVSDDDFLGFVVWEADPNSLEVLYQTNGGALVDTFDTAITAVNMTLGIHFDGVSTVTFYVDGTSIGSVLTTTKLFPDTKEMTPSIFMKQGGSAININLDWIKLVSER